MKAMRIVSVLLKADIFQKYLLSKNELTWFPAFKELLSTDVQTVPKETVGSSIVEKQAQCYENPDGRGTDSN